MAAAEARAAWQRTANRCFVQEDAKRAPKLACCPTSSVPNQQFDSGPGDAANGSDHPVTGFVPFNWNPSNSNLPPETKWWLQLQPSFGYQKDLIYGQLNQAEFDVLKAGIVNQTSNHNGNLPSKEEDVMQIDTEMKNSEPSLDSQWRILGTSTKYDLKVRTQELKAIGSKFNKLLDHKGMGEYCCQDELMDLDLGDRLSSKQTEKLYLDIESPWMRGEKTEPWWRTADKDELASLVAQKSLEHIENCDLPRPQTMNVRRGPFTCLECFNHERNFALSLDQKAHIGLSSLTCSRHTQYSPSLGGVNGKWWASSEAGYYPHDSDKELKALNELGQAQHGSEKSFRYKNYGTANKNATVTQHTDVGDPSKAELLEALRHSQTRAREAEKAAQQAYTEKEHIVKLFFRQASHLFAYRQWFQLLQLETLCLHLKSTDQPVSTFFPVALPWMPYKHQQSKKSRRKRRPPRYDISQYAIAFAVGLSLVGAGLLLGWTMGWLLPTF